MPTTKSFNQRKEKIEQLNESVLEFSANPYASANTPEEVSRNLTEAAANSPLVAGLTPEQGARIGSAWAGAIKNCFESTGQMPRAEIMASAAETLLSMNSNGSDVGGKTNFFESAAGSIADTKGQIIRATAGAMILPSMLSAATSDMATFIQGGKDKVECYKVSRLVGASFGDLNAGDEVADGYTGQYSLVQQTYGLPVTFDGTKKNVIAYIYNEANPLSDESSLIGVIPNYNPKGSPFIPHSVRLICNGQVVATSLGQDNSLTGVLTHGGTNYYIHGIPAMKPAQGIIAFSTNEPLPAEVKILVQYDVDIENSANVPEINHSMSSVILTPHASIIAAQHTVQAFWSLNREFGLNLTSFQAKEQQVLLAYDRDINNLRQALIASVHKPTKLIDMKLAAGQYFVEKYEELKRYLLELSQEMLDDNKTSGLVGMYCGTALSTMIKSLPSTLFTPAAGYRQVPRIHYCGLLFGMFRIYEVPVTMNIDGITLDITEAVCYGRGDQYGQAGLVNGDAVATGMYEHGVNSQMQKRQTLWGTRFNDIHPDAGHKYFRKVKVTLA